MGVGVACARRCRGRRARERRRERQMNYQTILCEPSRTPSGDTATDQAPPLIESLGRNECFAHRYRCPKRTVTRASVEAVSPLQQTR